MEVFKPTKADKMLINYLSETHEMYSDILRSTGKNLYENFLQAQRTGSSTIETQLELMKEVDKITAMLNALTTATTIFIETYYPTSELFAFALMAEFAYIANVYAPEDHKARVQTLIEAKRKENTPAPKQNPKDENPFTVGKSFDFFTSTKS